MRRVLIFSLAYYPDLVGGAEVAVKEITDRISVDEIEFDMITVRKGQSSFGKIGNVNIHRVGLDILGSGRIGKPSMPLRFAYILLAFRKALQLNGKRKYDVIWSIMASYAGSAAYLFKIINRKIPFLLTIQEGEHFGRRQSGLFRFFFKKIFKSADKIQVISKFLKEWSREMGAVCPIEVIPNGVDYQHFSKSLDGNKRDEIRSGFGFRKEDIVIVTASRLVEKNAIDDLIRAMNDLESAYKLLLVGVGEDESKLKELVREMGLSERIKFAGYIGHKDLPEYLQSSDVFVRASRTEGLGNAFLEAMASGLPVIGTPVGGIRDFLIDGQTGLLCEVNNPSSIAQKIKEISKNKELRDHIVKKATEMVREKYQWDGIAERFNL